MVRPTPALLRGVDRAAFAVAFAVRLREHGIAVGFSGIETFTRALGAAGLGSLPQLYWVARISLVRRQRDLAVFDRVFAAVFDEVVLRLDPNARRGSPPRTEQSWASLPTVGPPGLDEEDGGGLPWVTLPAVAPPAGSPAQAEPALPPRPPSALGGPAAAPLDQPDAAQPGP